MVDETQLIEFEGFNRQPRRPARNDTYMRYPTWAEFVRNMNERFNKQLHFERQVQLQQELIAKQQEAMKKAADVTTVNTHTVFNDGESLRLASLLNTKCEQMTRRNRPTLLTSRRHQRARRLSCGRRMQTGRHRHTINLPMASARSTWPSSRLSTSPPKRAARSDTRSVCSNAQVHACAFKYVHAHTRRRVHTVRVPCAEGRRSTTARGETKMDGDTIADSRRRKEAEADASITVMLSRIHVPLLSQKWFYSNVCARSSHWFTQ